VICSVELSNYTHRIAYTYEVKRNGNVTQNHSGNMIKNPTQAKSEIANANQYVLVDLISVLINFPIVAQIYNNLL